jgi:flagellar biosynthesis protein FliP
MKPNLFSAPVQGALSTPMQIILLMTALTILPAIVMSITPFLRISIVLHFLRQALGIDGMG